MNKSELKELIREVIGEGYDNEYNEHKVAPVGKGTKMEWYAFAKKISQGNSELYKCIVGAYEEADRNSGGGNLPDGDHETKNFKANINVSRKTCAIWKKIF